MKRSASILLVAGILAGALFLATRRSEAPGTALVPDASATSAPTPRDLDAQTAAPTTENRTPAATPGRAAASAVDADSGWSVCVLDARGEPVAGATVTVLDSTAIFRETSERGIGFDTVAGLRLRHERAVEMRTGADGCAHVAAPPKNAMVEARAEAGWAFTVVNQFPKDRRVTLRLGPDRPLLVRVLDGGGTPVGGVPVALRRRTVDRPAIAYTWKWTDSEPGTGPATFLHFQRRLEQGSGWHVVFAFPVRGEPVVPVDAETPIEPPVTLVLPDTGRVRVRARAADGSVPDLDGAELQVEAFESAAGGPPVWPGGPWSTPRLGQAGDALVPWIGLGLHVRAKLVRGEVAVAARSIPGPTRAGEEVVCELEWLAAAPRFVSGRFVMDDGRAWPAATVEAQPQLFPAPRQWPRPRQIRVDTQGRFRLQVDEPRPESGSRAYRFTAPHPEGLGQVIALVALNQEIPPQGLELGDVLLDHGILLVSGRVLETARRPIPGASFAVHVRAIVRESEMWPLVRASGTLRTTDDGAFALFLPPGETLPSDDLRLTASAPGWVSDVDRSLRPGERNVEIVLSQAGALAGSLDLDRGLRTEDVQLFLVSSVRRFVALHADATFEVDALQPGLYSLEACRRRVSGELETAARIEGLLVRAGETCRDPRLQGLRIENPLTTLRIRVVDRASTPLKDAAASIVGQPGARPAMAGGDGVCLVRCASLPVDLDVSAFGYARQRLTGVSAEHEVVLDDGFPVRLRAGARTSESAHAYLLWVMVFSVDGSGVRRGLTWEPEQALGRTSFDERGELALRLPAPGEYECDVRVTVIVDHVGRGARVELGSPLRLTVRASREEQLFELPIPQAAIDAAVAAALLSTTSGR